MPRIKGESTLRWSHFHALAKALDKPQSTVEAVKEAGIPVATWRRLRSRWIAFDLERMLCDQDPEGTPCDLYHIDELVRAKRPVPPGRPRGAQDTRPRTRSPGKRPAALETVARPLPEDLAERFL